MASTFKATKLASSPCAWRWDATTRIRQALGFQSSKMPASFHGTFKVDGWKIVVKRGKKKTTVGGRPMKSAEHRLFVDHGGRLIPTGRVRQALCKLTIHKAKKARQRRAARR